MNSLIFNTLKNMFTNRGYTSVQFEGDNLVGLDTDGKRVIALPLISKLDKEQLNEIVKSPETHLILVHKSITPNVGALIENIHYLGKTVELFQDYELFTDLTKHKFYQPHLLVSDDEKDELKQKLSIANLPRILTTDAVSRYFFFAKGDVVKIFEDEIVKYFVVA